MKYIAKEFLLALDCGLTLVGQEEGNPQFIANREQWKTYRYMLEAQNWTIRYK